MNLGRRYDYCGYERVNRTGFGVNSWSPQPQTPDDSYIFTRSSNFWKRTIRKGNRVNIIGGSLTIKIGGDTNTLNKPKTKDKRQNNRVKSTKYSLITFLPQNLLEQFRRIANFYFLVMSFVAFVIDSPVSPLTSIAPLVFVIVVTATKQGYEDYLRYRADNMVNYSLVTVIRNGKEVSIKCQDIRQGDLVKVERDCDVPCDVVLLKSADRQGRCHVTTANLDGETNLKSLHVPKGLPDVGVEKLHTLGIVECEHPRTDLYTFNGKIDLSSVYRSTPMLTESSNSLHGLPLMAENLLLRGSRIKNTEWIIGCAVYTGAFTKLALNSRLTNNKIASSEVYINKFLVFILVILILVVTTCYFMKRYCDELVTEHSYLGLKSASISVAEFLQDYLSFLILFNYLIPISLYVTIEMHKFLGAFYLEWDINLYDDETDQPCIVNTSDLNEELGQVNILFSDKTGTLTKNEMHLQQCSIRGRKFLYKGTSLQEEGTQFSFRLNKFNDDQLAFFQALTICHTVQVAGDLVEEENFDDQDPLIPDANNLQGSYTFSNITEESETSHRTESEIDETDFMQISRPNTPVTKFILEKQKPNETSFGSSKKGLRRNNNNNKIHPITGIAEEPTVRSPTPKNIQTSQFLGDNLFSGVIPEKIFQRSPNGRPISMEFNRSNSHLDMVAVEDRLTFQTHRRAQSYGTPSTFKKRESLNSIRRPHLNRTLSMLSTRESYAAPQYTSDTLQRKASSRRRDEIRSVLENLDYQASSPDEKALVEACASLGLLYIGDEDDVIQVQCFPSAYSHINVSNAKVFSFKRLHVLEFTSDRKRMSVIVRDKKGEVWIYTKGAESYVFPLCTNATRPGLVNVTNRHITDFSKLGLRTLAVARRKIREDEYLQFQKDLKRAKNSLSDRKRLVEEVYLQVERQLELMGATAVEDALQDNVRDTLVSLGKAGIKIWVLTGDKVETALNIALSCGHISEYAQKYFITECVYEQDVKEHLSMLENEIKRNNHLTYALLIDGKSLTLALKEHSTKFRDVSIRCGAVLCCRLSPLQKCEVVQLIKTAPEKYITAAIGDGANDVSMIQEAHVGLGIVGKEGRQAARCADYAFANFSMVKRILLVHGHYFTDRMAILVLYFFYKNLIFMTVQFFFQFDSMFSTQSIFDSLFLTLYNVLYTAMPVLFISLTEQPYSEDQLTRTPSLYKENTGYKRLHWKYFLGWMLLALYHGLIVYEFSRYMWVNTTTILTSPRTVDLSCFGTFLMHNLVVLVNIKLWLEAVYQTYIFIATIWFSILGFVLSTVIYNFLDMQTGRTIFDSIFQYDSDMYWVYNIQLSSITFWTLSILMMVACLLPDLTHKFWTRVLKMKLPSIYPGDRLQRARLKAAEAKRELFRGPIIESTNL